MLKLDHLVILVPDLLAAVADYQQLGFTVTPGGTHADGLTHNALIAFADGTYIELIAFVDPADTRDNVWGWRKHMRHNGGLIDYCMAADNLAASVTTFRTNGLNISDPAAGGRQRPDGTALQWRSAHFWQAGRELPFLIEDVTPRSLRVPGGSAAQHANNVTGIRELVIAVTNLDRLAENFTILSASALPAFRPDRRRDGQSATFNVGTHCVTLIEPRMQASAVQQHLETQGLGPYEVVLETTDGSNRKQLDPRLAHGARLWID